MSNTIQLKNVKTATYFELAAQLKEASPITAVYLKQLGASDETAETWRDEFNARLERSESSLACLQSMVEELFTYLIQINERPSWAILAKDAFSCFAEEQNQEFWYKSVIYPACKAAYLATYTAKKDDKWQGGWISTYRNGGKRHDEGERKVTPKACAGQLRKTAEMLIALGHEKTSKLVVSLYAEAKRQEAASKKSKKSK